MVCAAAAEPQASSPPVTVRDLVRQAAEQNKDVLALRERIREAEGFLRQAGVRPASAIEATGLTGRPLGTVGEEEYSAGYVLPIERSGKRGGRIRVAEIGVSLAEAEIAERVRQLAFDVKARYAEAAGERGKLEAIERLLSFSQEFLRLTDARVDEGDAAPLERDLLKVELSREQALRATFVGRAGAALVELQRAAALETLPSPSLAQAAFPESGFDLREVQRRAAAARPDLRRARLEEEQAGAAADLAEAEGKPDFTVSARYARRNAQFDGQRGFNSAGVLVPLRDRDDVLSVGIAVPLWGRNRNLGNMEAASARAASGRLRRQHLEAAIPLEVEAAWRRHEAAKRVLTILNQDVLPQSENNLAIMREAYELGQLRLLDVLAEQRRLIETQLSFIDSQVEAARALAELERAIGDTLP
jgi:cobalt-zinc-cadmium efflux system outer membrane protein